MSSRLLSLCALITMLAGVIYAASKADAHSSYLDPGQPMRPFIATIAPKTISIRAELAPGYERYVLPNGHVVTTSRQLAEEVSQSMRAANNSVIIEMTLHLYNDRPQMTYVPVTPGAHVYTPQWGFGRPIGSYYVRVSIERGYVGGCIGRTCWHVGFMISKQGVNQPLIDLHICSWFDWGGPQIGLYNSGSAGQFCIKTRLNYDNLRNVLFAAAATATGAAIGGAIADISAAPVYSMLFLLI